MKDTNKTPVASNLWLCDGRNQFWSDVNSDFSHQEMNDELIPPEINCIKNEGGKEGSGKESHMQRRLQIMIVKGKSIK